MDILILEIKAKCTDQTKIRNILNDKNADFKGKDHQIDTYFKVNHGRLKLREGQIEQNLIHYKRENKKGPKASNVILFKADPSSNLKSILTAANGILTVVDKQREIYFIDNVKFHIDTVQDLGDFIEIEAIDTDGSIGHDALLKQCQSYLDLFEVADTDLLSVSYSDMLIGKLA